MKPIRLDKKIRFSIVAAAILTIGLFMASKQIIMPIQAYEADRMDDPIIYCGDILLDEQNGRVTIPVRVDFNRNWSDQVRMEMVFNPAVLSNPAATTGNDFDMAFGQQTVGNVIFTVFGRTLLLGAANDDTAYATVTFDWTGDPTIITFNDADPNGLELGSLYYRVGVFGPIDTQWCAIGDDAVTPTHTPTHTPTQTEPPTNTPTHTPTQTNTPTNTPTPSITPTPSNTPTPFPTSAPIVITTVVVITDVVPVTETVTISGTTYGTVVITNTVIVTSPVIVTQTVIITETVIVTNTTGVIIDTPSSVSGSAGGQIFESDSNIPLSNVIIRLLDSNGTIIDVAVTDVNGLYQFTDLTLGQYTVTLDNLSLPSSIQAQFPVYSPDNGADHSSTFFLTESIPNNDTQDFGYVNSTSNSPLVGSVGGRIFLIDQNSTSLANVRVYLYDRNGNLIDTTITDGNGLYQFTNLTLGQYTVTLDSTTLPAVIQGQPPAYSSDNGTDHSSTFLLTASVPDNDVQSFAYSDALSAALSSHTATAPPAVITLLTTLILGITTAIYRANYRSDHKRGGR